MSTETVSQQLPAGTWTADPVHSSINFAITHNGVASFRSGFTSYEGTLTGGESPRLEGAVDVASVDISDEMLKGHLLSLDFFDAEKHPRIKFASTELSVGEDGAVRLSGDLEIKGESHAVQATGRFGRIGADITGKERLGFSLEASIDRRNFGLDWNADLPNGGRALEYEVSIVVELELVAQEA
ncbi:MAG: YceI family protein [Solirubrobacterales bacterium]